MAKWNHSESRRGRRRPRGYAAGASIALVVLSGCGLAYPRLRGPGTLWEQRSRAVIHDPYPDQEAGPEIVSGRPRAFLHPLPEADRNRLLQQRMLGMPANR